MHRRNKCPSGFTNTAGTQGQHNIVRLKQREQGFSQAIDTRGKNRIDTTSDTDRST
jgi:hypothetical protein